jgi:hypothetical protein
MRKILVQLGFILLALSISGCVTTPSKPLEPVEPSKPLENQMTNEELTMLLKNGKKLKLGDSTVNYKGEISLTKDRKGEGVVRLSSGKTIELKGTWEIVGNEFCRKWGSLDGGNEVCERWVKISKNKVHVYKGQKNIGVNSW